MGQSYGCEWRSKDLSVHWSWAKRQCAPIAGRNFAARILGKELNSVSEIWSMSPWSLLHYIHLAKTTKSSSTSNTVITLTNWQKESLHPTIILRFCPDRHRPLKTRQKSMIFRFLNLRAQGLWFQLFFVKPTSRS